MLSQTELARRFVRGAEGGQASNVEITRVCGGTALVGYGWAVYAYRDDDGHVTYFRGWHGYSRSTSSQIGKMGLSSKADEVSDRQPSVHGSAGGWRSDATPPLSDVVA